MTFKNNLIIWGKDFFTFPVFGTDVFLVLHRHWMSFTYQWHLVCFITVLEPLIYFSAFGYGLGSYVTQFTKYSFSDFILPSVLILTSTISAYIESSFNFYCRYKSKNSYEVMRLSSISYPNILIGEMAWALIKSSLPLISMVFIAGLLGEIHTWLIFPAILIILLGAWLFSAIGIVISSIFENEIYFTVFLTTAILPLMLFSETFFPLKNIPLWIQNIITMMPIWHLVQATRSLLWQKIDNLTVLNISYLFVLTIFLTNVAIARMTRKMQATERHIK